MSLALLIVYCDDGRDWIRVFGSRVPAKIPGAERIGPISLGWLVRTGLDIGTLLGTRVEYTGQHYLLQGYSATTQKLTLQDVQTGDVRRLRLQIILAKTAD